MKTTRQRLLEHLAERRTATAAELSQTLHVTPANVRHHLSVLKAEGVVDVVGQRQGRSPGRPVQVYGLRSEISSHNLAGLAGALLKVLYENRSEDSPEAGLKALAVQLVKPEAGSGGSLSQRLSDAVLSLNKKNYQARWEAHSTGPRLIFSHCPYAAILDDHPELCRLDALMLEEMFGMSANQLARLEVNFQGISQCIFGFQKKADIQPK
jgi:predicted ArsR family transcriptional regulator